MHEKPSLKWGHRVYKFIGIFSFDDVFSKPGRLKVFAEQFSFEFLKNSAQLSGGLLNDSLPFIGLVNSCLFDFHLSGIQKQYHPEAIE